MKTRLLSAVAFMLIAIPALANTTLNNITLGTPTYGGRGCPAGTLMTTLSATGEEIFTSFDEFVVEAGEAAGKIANRKSCNIEIPINLPEGYRVAVASFEYSGFLQLPSGTSAQLSTSFVSLP